VATACTQGKHTQHGNADGSELLITRRADAPDRISLLDSANEVRHILATDEMPFPISILGWHEIEAVADQAEARISLLDRIGNAAEIKQLYIQMKASVEQARDLLPLLQRQIKQLEVSLKEMWELLLDAKFVDIFDVIDDDDVEIELNVGKVGFVPIQNLSAGQRCVAAFPLHRPFL
jgi:hypothetical protein